MQDVIDLTVTPLSRACGAEIRGVDLTRELSDATVRAIKQAWGEHLVLVFRGQSITQEQQLRFASYFGELGDRKVAPEPLRGRTEGIQQDHKTQRLDIAAAPREVHRRAAVRNTSVNRAPQIEPPPTAANLIASNEPRTHDACEAFGKRVSLRYVFRARDMAKIGRRQIFGA